MKLNKESIECLKIIEHYTNTMGHVGLSILERNLFDLIGFDYAIQNNIRLTSIIDMLSKEGFVIEEGLSNKITEKGREFLKQHKESQA